MTENYKKKGWYRVDSQLASPYRELFCQNKFLLFYDKNQVVGPHNEKAWLRVWGKRKYLFILSNIVKILTLTANTERDKKENLQLIDCAQSTKSSVGLGFADNSKMA
jgi:hypothetical protein